MVTHAGPTSQDHAIIRSERQATLIDQVVLNAVVTSFTSPQVLTGPYRKFTLYLRIKSSGAPTTVQFIVEFLSERSGKWHTYKQGLFASLYYEDADTATEVDEMFSGDCAGRAMRIRAVGTGTSATLTFTVSASVEFSD